MHKNVSVIHIVDCVSSWLYKHTIYTNVDEIITLRTNQCKRRITFYRQELIFISNAQSSCLWWIISDRDTFSKTHFKNFTLHGKIHKEMRTEVLNKTASAWLLKIVMILIPLQALECFWWASVCKFFGGGLLLQEFANACSSMAFCRCCQDHHKFSKSCWGPSDQSSAVFSEIYNPTYFVYLAYTLNPLTFSCLECRGTNLYNFTSMTLKPLNHRSLKHIDLLLSRDRWQTEGLVKVVLKLQPSFFEESLHISIFLLKSWPSWLVGMGASWKNTLYVCLWQSYVDHT